MTSMFFGRYVGGDSDHKTPVRWHYFEVPVSHLTNRRNNVRFTTAQNLQKTRSADQWSRACVQNSRPSSKAESNTIRKSGRVISMEKFGNVRAGISCDKYGIRMHARHTYLASRLTVINEAVPPGRDLPIAHRAG